MTPFVPMAPFLIQAADSATTRIVVENGWLANVASIGQGIVSLLVTVMLVLIVLMLFALKKSLDELTNLVKSSHEPVHAVLQDARAVTSELRTLTQSVREPVTRIVETVDLAGGRVRSAMVRAERRLERLDALAGVVQDEAEELVVKSASVARGLRVGGAAVGAALLGRGGGRGRERRPASRARIQRNGDSHDLRAGATAFDNGEPVEGPTIRRERGAERARERVRASLDGDDGPRIRPRGGPAT